MYVDVNYPMCTSTAKGFYVKDFSGFLDVFIVVNNSKNRIIVFNNTKKISHSFQQLKKIIVVVKNYMGKIMLLKTIWEKSCC